MKTKILLFLLCLASLNAMGQGTITRNRKTEQKTEQKPAQKPKQRQSTNPKPTAEAAGYDVAFSCNVSSASLYIDGNANGTASGTRFLKTGSHSIRITASGYEDYSRNITVNRQNTSFSITLNKKQELTQQNSRKNKTYTVDGVSFTMIAVKAGSFQMGSSSDYSKEKPVHNVTITKDYYIGETEVTQALWKAVTGNSPTSSGNSWSSFYGIGDNYPAYNISYEDVCGFITKLNAKTGQNFRMPTEAEWEYAARGGDKSKGYTYSGSNTIEDVAWYKDNSADKTHPVKTKSPNELGIYDMSGNVYEWCSDWFDSSYYSSSPTSDPPGPYSGSERVLRGGGWFFTATLCRTVIRNHETPSGHSNHLGFRLACSSSK